MHSKRFYAKCLPEFEVSRQCVNILDSTGTKQGVSYRSNMLKLSKTGFILTAPVLDMLWGAWILLPLNKGLLSHYTRDWAQ